MKNILEIGIHETELKYLELLASKFPTIGETATEIINLEAILNLPKGTEHFISDIHGEYEAFNHVLKNGSGVIKQKIEELFKSSLREADKKELANLIYYPEEKISLLEEKEKNIEEWYKISIYRLVQICRLVSSKYTSSKVRKSLPEDFSYIIQELIYERDGVPNKEEYVKGIIDTIVSIGRAKSFIITISNVIQRLTVDRLHVVGDIYDRGPAPHKIIDRLISYHNADVQWGNHDILWMGAAAGNEGCIANVIRICTRYSNTDVLEEGYGINLLPLAIFAMEHYKNDKCEKFLPKSSEALGTNIDIMAKMHKAITVIQFKIEAQIIKRNPEFKMEDRILLDKIDYEKGTIKIDEREYNLTDKNFPTIDPKNPLALTEEEKNVIKKLKSYFLGSEKLQKHTKFLYANGSIYLKCNSNLLYHGCIPLDSEGKFQKIKIQGVTLQGREYLDTAERLCREGYFYTENGKFARDFIWYLWNGTSSPLFGKEKMRTFERYFIEDKEAHIEKKNPYYSFYEKEEVVDMFFKEFGLDPKNSYIINGHIPVKVKKGENPVKANGKLFIIDGGFSKAYQSTTGIAGYTLIYNSIGLKLVAHEPFESTEKAIKEGIDIESTEFAVQRKMERIRVRDTDIGKKLTTDIEELKKLLYAYRKGIIKEKR